MKIIWIDVGTHFAQEHSSIFGSNYSFYSFILKRFLSGKILKRGKFISFKELKSVFHSRTRIRKNIGFCIGKQLEDRAIYSEL